ncbi:hypothetical protein ACFP7A_11530 [Sporolactobacillus kofuensis]|uniref:Uncharacterized protein n=1 Tax=Sporolactobacillus kofuensis TaxID=269672 RepID=A0ABW1WHY9_9BACL
MTRPESGVIRTEWIRIRAESGDPTRMELNPNRIRCYPNRIWTIGMKTSPMFLGYRK